MKSLLLKKICFALAMVCTSVLLRGQVLNAPEPADNPNIPGNSAWTAACASENFNEYFVNFRWSPPVVGSNNQFILELSDNDGNFDNATTLQTLSDKNSTFDFEFSFELPADTRGDAYRFRVRSTSPALTSPPSEAFPMYYIGYRDPILISRDGNGEIPSAGNLLVCNGEPTTLATHNVDNPENYEYNWYINGMLRPERSNTITITDPGQYAVEIDYGESCSGSANTLSNSILVSYATTTIPSISADSSTNICNGQTVTLSADVDDDAMYYTWFKDDLPITAKTLGASSLTIDSNTLDFAGNYYLELQGDNPCSENSNSIAITDAGHFTATLENEETVLLLPTKSVSLGVSTTANDPVYQWYQDNDPIPDATSASYEATEPGNYHVELTQSGPCSNSSITSPITTVVNPENFTFYIDHLASYSACTASTTSLVLFQIEALTSDGTLLDVTDNLLEEFTYFWTKDGEPLNAADTHFIDLSGSENNGNYILNGSLGAYEISSNPIEAKLTEPGALVIESENNLLCSNTDLQITTAFQLEGQSYEWLKDGQALDVQTPALLVSSVGEYQLKVYQNGCSIISNPITVGNFDDAQVVLDVEEEVVVPSGSSLTVNASGASAYRWFDENDMLLGSEASITVTKAGTYSMVAQTGTCESTRFFTVTLKDTFEIPNVITVNGDGFNDQWILPNTYSGNPDITVLIYDSFGNEVLSQQNYRNDWPRSITGFSGQKMVFYYIIKQQQETLKQGTITVIR